MKSATIYTKINSLPENLKKEVDDFVNFLLSKKAGSKPDLDRKAGFLKGRIFISPDFREPLSDFKDYR